MQIRGMKQIARVLRMHHETARKHHKLSLLTDDPMPIRREGRPFVADERELREWMARQVHPMTAPRNDD